MADAPPSADPETWFVLRHGEATTSAQAEVAVRYGDAARIARGVGVMALGLALGAACVVVPVLHLITTWALPAGGLALGVYLLNTRSKVAGLRGECPACGEPGRFASASLEGTVEAVCPACFAFVQVTPAALAPDPGDAAPG